MNQANQTSESAKNDNGLSMAGEHSLYPREFRNRDFKLLLFLFVSAVAIILLWAYEAMPYYSFRNIILSRFWIVLPVPIMVLSKSNKKVFTLLPDSIEIGNYILISCDNIQKIKLTKSLAVIFYNDSFGKEKKADIDFSELSSHDEARSALLTWFHEHGLQSRITEK